MQAVVVDNTSPQIEYLTGWDNGTAHPTDYNETTTYFENPNSGFRFTFNGTSISVYGCVLPNNTAVSTYMFDNETLVPFTNNYSAEYSSQQLFYHSPSVPYGEHTLVVTAPDSAPGLPWTTYCFDYLAYTSSASSTAVAAASMSESTTTPGFAESTPESTTALPGGSKGSSLKVILPAVLVPCAVVVALLAMGLYLRRKRRSGQRVNAEQAGASYRQTSLLHRTPSSATMDDRASEKTLAFDPDLPGALPKSPYSSKGKRASIV